MLHQRKWNGIRTSEQSLLLSIFVLFFFSLLLLLLLLLPIPSLTVCAFRWRRRHPNQDRGERDTQSPCSGKTGKKRESELQGKEAVIKSTAWDQESINFDTRMRLSASPPSLVVVGDFSLLLQRQQFIPTPDPQTQRHTRRKSL